MPIYSYLREDGEWVDRIFPITNSPKEIVCEDGVHAKKGVRPGSSFNFSWKAGQEPSSFLKSQNEKRRKDNINAGKKGEKDWRARMPKLVFD